MTAPTSQRRLVLASGSPRRLELLREAGFTPEVIKPHLDDGELIAPDARRARDWVAALANLKARCVRDELTPRNDAIVLGSDTVVVKGGRIIGQPRDATHAREMILSLREGEHIVATGVALLLPDGRRLVVEQARVRVGAVEDDVIEHYIASEQWRGKAGGYNFSERVEAGWDVRTSDDPNTIMGLPVATLTPTLVSLGVLPSDGSGEARSDV